jgi:hypothetical protein
MVNVANAVHEPPAWFALPPCTDLRITRACCDTFL